MTQVDLTQGEIDTTLRDTRTLAGSRGMFYFGMAVAMSVTVFIGFGPSSYVNAYFAETLGLPPLQALPSIVIVHGLVLTTWMILLMVQTGFVAGGRVRWHRRLGIAGAVLAAAVVVFGTAVQLASTQRDLGALDSVPFLRIVVFSGFTMIAFAGLAGAAICWRRRPEIHKRLILIATIALLSAATARIGRIVGFAVPAIGPLPFLGLVLTDSPCGVTARHKTVWRYRDENDYYIVRANALEHNVVLCKVENGRRSPLGAVGRGDDYGVKHAVPAGQSRPVDESG